MVLNCVFCGKKMKGAENISFHKFPLSHPGLLQQWLQNMNLGLQFQPTATMRLCSNHFSADVLKRVKSEEVVLPGSVPTIFDRYKSACVYCDAKKSDEKKRSFHVFPAEKPLLLGKWTTAMNLPDFTPSKQSFLCSDHFTDSCFKASKDNYRRLKPNAVPSVFEPRLKEEDTPRNASETEPSVKKRRRDDADSIVPLTSTYGESTMAQPDMDEAVVGVKTEEDAEMLSEMGPNTPTVEKTPTRAVNSEETPSLKRRLFHVTNDHNYNVSPITARRKLRTTAFKAKKLRNDLRIRKQHVLRLKKKVASLKAVVQELRRTRAFPESGLETLDSIADNDVTQFLQRYFKKQKIAASASSPGNKRKWKNHRRTARSGISREKYPPELRSFALTLHFYSPKAYAFVRRKFCFALPDPSTLRGWYSSVDGEPGFTSESFEILKRKVCEAKKNDKEVLVSFMLDEIGIKKGLQLLPNNILRGYVDIGCPTEDDSNLSLAKDALVLMVVSLDSSWKIPIGFFLVNGIDCTTNAGLITDALIRLNDIGVKVVSLTLDGPEQHFATVRNLGAKFDISNLQPHFPHPRTGDKVHVIFDACHMLKLMRNCFGDVKVMKDSEGDEINWKFIASLAQLQQQEGLRAGNKLRPAQIAYFKMKMTVSLAAQTLSSSVADSITFCDKYLGLPEFQGSAATVRFIRCIDRIFDFMNSRNPLGKGYKSPLRRTNEVFWREDILTMVEYLKGITDVQGKPMYSMRRYVPFTGFITGVMSVISIFDAYVKPDTSQIGYLLTYKLSQDYIELFFCAIRSCGGWCPNPTCAQFISAYKRLLIHHQVEEMNGNVDAMNKTTCLTISSSSCRQTNPIHFSDVNNTLMNINIAKKYGLENDFDINTNEENPLAEFLQFPGQLSVKLTDLSETCVAHIAGWVVKKIVDKTRPIIHCEQCRAALYQDSETSSNLYFNYLIEVKSRGGLIFPSESVFTICKTTEQFLRNSLNVNNGLIPPESGFTGILCSKVLHELMQSPCNIFPTLNDHLFDNSPDETNHIFYLTKVVCMTYLKVRLFASTEIASERLTGEKLRHHLTRQIVWRHQ